MRACVGFSGYTASGRRARVVAATGGGAANQPRRCVRWSDAVDRGGGWLVGADYDLPKLVFPRSNDLVKTALA